MAKIRFETGQVVNFDGNPTPQDVEEVAKSLGINQPSDTGTPEPTIPPQTFDEQHPILSGITNPVADVATGFLKGAGQTIATVPQNISKVIGGLTKYFMGTGAEEGRGQLATITTKLIRKASSLPEGDVKREELNKTIQENMKSLGLLSQEEQQRQTQMDTFSQTPEFLQQTNTAQQIGGFAENLVELGLLGKFTGGALSSLPEAAGVLTKQTVKAGLGGLQFGLGAAAKGKSLEEIQKETGLGVGFSVAESLGGLVLKKVGSFLGNVGRRVQMNVLKPSARDIQDGFKIENVTKYDVGGTLTQSLVKINAKMNQLGKQLEEKLTANPEARIDLTNVYEDTWKYLSGNKAKDFGDISRIRKVLGILKNEIRYVGNGNSEVDLVTANTVKRAAGTKGAWVFNSPDPDASAIETVYNAFYHNLKVAIENNAPQGVKEINKAMSELIPINNAIIRRIPIEQRGGVPNLIDAIGLFATAANPKAIALLAGIKALKSGRTGAALVGAESKLGNVSRLTP